MESLSDHLGALSHWARWAARLHLDDVNQSRPGATEAQRLIGAHALVAANSHVAPPGWLAASNLITSFVAMSRSEGVRLTQMYESSKRRLWPLSDPLDVLFHFHRQLSSSREEVYSDWFQWVLSQVADARLIGQILGTPIPDRFANSKGPVSVEREIWVEHGHVDQTGRLDIVVSQGLEKLAVIEVKTREYSREDLQKHIGYARAIKTSSPQAEMILLAVDPPDTDLSGFRFLSWDDVCVTLRGIAPSLLVSERPLATALILAFVGAVEQNLLGLTSPEIIPLPLDRVPRTVDHFARAAQMEELLGAS